MTGDRPRFGPLHNTPRWYLVLAVAWSAVVLSLPWIVVATMGERLPDPVASHWGADGVPDGFTPLATAWVWPAVIGLLLVALLLGLGMAMRQLRSMVSFSLGLATFLGVLGAGTLVAQVDGAAAEAPVDAAAAEASVDAALAWSMAAGVAVGISAALLVRRLSPVAVARPTAGNAHSSSPTASPAGARPVPSWTGETRTSRGAVIGGWAAVVPLAVSVVVFVVDRQWVMAGAMMALGAVIGLLMLAFLHATVLVDADGVRVRSLGRSWVAIPLAEIERADPVVVHWGEFGGIGLRAQIGSEGATGLITSSGDAVRIDRFGQGPFYVTLDPADQVAALINTLVARTAPR